MADRTRIAPDALDQIEALRREVIDLRRLAGLQGSSVGAAEIGWRDLVQSANTIVLRWDLEGRVTFLNEYGLDFFGYRPEQLLGLSVVGTIVPEAESSGRDLVQMINELLEHPDRYVDNENENMRRTGERVWVTWRNRPLADESGRIRELLSIGIDTTKRKRAEEALRDSERRYRALFQSTPIPLVERDASALRLHIEELRRRGVVDFEGHLQQHPEELALCLQLVRVSDMNAAAMELFETGSPGDLDAYSQVTDAAAFARLVRTIVADLASGAVSSEQREGVIRTLQGRKRNVLVRTTVVPGSETDLSRIITALIDITERKHAEEALRASEERYRELSVRDNLTGLYNTRYLYARLGALLASGDGPCSVLFMDLDRFKQLVDTYGHLNGSRAIQEVGQTIQERLREPAFAVAYAGDEFVIVLPGFGKAAAVQAAGEIQSRIRDRVFLAGEGHGVRISASLGVATCPDDASDMPHLLAVADQALFGAKSRGRDRILAV